MKIIDSILLIEAKDLTCSDCTFDTDYIENQFCPHFAMRQCQPTVNDRPHRVWMTKEQLIKLRNRPNAYERLELPEKGEENETKTK